MVEAIGPLTAEKRLAQRFPLHWHPLQNRDKLIPNYSDNSSRNWDYLQAP